MKKNWLLFIIPILAISTYLSYHYLSQPTRTSLPKPFQTQPTPKPLPLNQYSLPNLRDYNYQTSPITLTQQEQTDQDFSRYLFKYQTMGKTMTGTAYLPTAQESQQDAQATQSATDNLQQPLPVIIMIRGYATPEQYYPGFGTQHAAEVFAKNGYVTLAPDFFGFAQADPAPDNNWEARFIKPINIIELLKSVQTKPELDINLAETEETALASLNHNSSQTIQLNPNQIGLWGHSNGGQIALSVLEIIEPDIPTTIWAPVTAPFPYSILFFTYDNPDEGKEARAWLAQFEQDYDVFDFSISQHLDQLTGPLTIHHGSDDQSAPITWSDYFVSLIEQENQQRQQLVEKQSTKTATQSDEVKDRKVQIKPIIFSYYQYPGADHNLQPASNWNLAIQRDLEFFSSHFNSPGN